MKNCLILLTQKYPFETGEEFIEKELMTLSRYYDEIKLLPTLARDHTQKREIPENVEVINFKNPQGAIEIILNFLKSLPHFFTHLVKEMKFSGTNFGLFKYYFYHIPLGIKVKRSIKPLIVRGNSYSFYSYWMDTNAFGLSLLKSEIDINYFIRSHGADLYAYRYSHNQIPFRKIVYKNVNKIFPISHDGRRYILNSFPELDSKVKVSFLGVGKQLLGPINKEIRYRIVSCSSVIPLKRIDKIATVISNTKLNIEWVHFGGTSDQMSKVINFVSLGSHVHFIHKAQVLNKVLLDYYKEVGCDIFINLSETEGIPVSIMEAISFGIPILSNDVGGISEIVNEKTGILVNVDDSPTQIAHTLKKYLLDGRTRDPLVREQVFGFFLENFNAEKNYKEFYSQIQGMQSVID